MTGTLCRLEDESQRRIRHFLGAPDGFASCAIVGSAGMLREERLGAEIDQHEFVIRENLSPVGGFEPIVGAKTSLRVINTPATRMLLERFVQIRDTDANITCPYPVSWRLFVFLGPKCGVILSFSCFSCWCVLRRIGSLRSI